MEKSVYIDVFFFTNFIADYILIYLTEKILHYKGFFKRRICAAFLGAFLTSILYCIFFFEGWKIRLFSNMGIGFLMVYIAFPKKKILQKIKILFLLCGTASFTGGLFLWVYYDTPIGYSISAFYPEKKKMIVLFFAMVLSIFFFRLVCSVQKENKFILDVTFSYRGKNVSTRGLLDTGNELLDSMTKKPVCIVEYSIFKPVLEEEYRRIIEEFLEHEAINLEQIAAKNLYDVKIISYHSIGRQDGKLMGVQIEQLSTKIEGEERIIKKPVLAFVKNPISRKRNYFAILNRRGLL